MALQFTKSPFNYVGNKYKQLPQLIEIFPKNINNFIDLFTGGADIATNMVGRAENIYANDINQFVIDIMKEFQTKTVEEILSFIDSRIKQFDLSKTNKENYFKYRDAYNNGTYSTPLDLFTLTRFSYNNNLRFNDKKEMNQAFGDRYFNPTMRKNFLNFYNKIQSINLSCLTFSDFDLTNFGEKDFIYADPPYLISDAYYNTGAKNAAQKWEQKDDLKLFDFLNKANEKKISFVMSNFIHHKGKTNEKLIEWINDMNLNIYDINSDYSHCIANINKNDSPTLEVAITNYKKENEE